uniref:FDX-ACB domain-containing protein n=1 Tax=Quercus lobata TaxID=97700 RepID=A0A7N2R413_QUELO
MPWRVEREYSPRYKDISFWINESFTENNLLCEVVRGIAGDLAEEYQSQDEASKIRSKRRDHRADQAISEQSLELNFAKSELVPVEEVQAMAEITHIVGSKKCGRVLVAVGLMVFLRFGIYWVQLIDNFTNKKGMTSHCYRIAYRLMECSLTDEEINELQWNVREQVQSKLNIFGSMEILLD